MNQNYCLGCWLAHTHQANKEYQSHTQTAKTERLIDFLVEKEMTSVSAKDKSICDKVHFKQFGFLNIK